VLAAYASAKQSPPLWLLIAALGPKKREVKYMKKTILKVLLMPILMVGLQYAHAEQTFVGEIEAVQVNNYDQGAAYVNIKGAQFNECQNPTSWCAIDFSLPAGNQMYSTVLAAKMAGKQIRIVSNGCWSTNYARCWKVTID